MYEDNREKKLSERFSDLAAIKKQQAAEFQAKEKAERDKNNLLLRWKAIRNGTVMEDDSTQAELELFASVDDISQLGLDENGHICLLSSLPQNAEEAQMHQQMYNEAPQKSISEESAEMAAQQRREALTAALAVSRKEAFDKGEPEQPLTEEVRELSGLMQSKVEETNIQQPVEVETEDNNVPVNVDARVLRVENLAVNESRVYIATQYNSVSQESSYGLYVEQGYGETRQAFVQGERLFNMSVKNMAFRAAMTALTPYARIGQPIRQVCIFMDRELGWELAKNSWQLTTEAFSLDAEAYCQIFKSCVSRNVVVRFAPAEANSVGQKTANEIAKQLIHTP